jgi:hypothetical protein
VYCFVVVVTLSKIPERNSLREEKIYLGSFSEVRDHHSREPCQGTTSWWKQEKGRSGMGWGKVQPHRASPSHPRDLLPSARPSSYL